MKKNRFRKLLVFILVFAWLFTGWPPIWPLGQLGVNTIRIPPRIQEIEAASPETFTSTGFFTPGTGFYAVDVACWGGGGAGGKGGTGNGDGGGGGAGGQYAKKSSISVAPETEYTVSIGIGGTSSTGNGNPGGDSTFNANVVVAKGGAGGFSYANGFGAGIGSTAGGIGDTVYAGGNGAVGSGLNSGGGGGGAGSTGIGSTASYIGGGKTTPEYGGGGGNGTAAVNGVGGSGTVYGGAGGGATKSSLPGSGAGGMCIVTYTDTWAPSTDLSTYSPTWSFASVPTAQSATAIGMTATTGYDSTTINYLFTLDNTGCGASAGTGGDSSSWQTSSSYTDEGLEPNKCYGYKVTTRDSMGTPNTGTASSVSSTFTSSAAVSITRTTDGLVDFDIVGLGQTASTTSAQKETVSVDSGPATLKVRSTLFSQGGNEWTLGTFSDVNKVKWEFSKDTGSWTTFEVVDNPYDLETSVPQGESRDLYLRITMPTETASYEAYSVTVTIVASTP